MKAFNEETYLKNLDSLKSLNYINFANANKLYNDFHSKLIAVIDENAPYKTLYKQESKIKQKLWITKSIIKSIKTKKIYYKKFVKKQNPVMIETALKKYHRNTLKN